MKGTVIHGTMRTQDIIPVLLECLEEVDPAAHAQMLMGSFGPIPAYVEDEGDDSDWWTSMDAQYLLEDLFLALDGAAPDGYYFGAHPGDGSDYGFWELEDL